MDDFEPLSKFFSPWRGRGGGTDLCFQTSYQGTDRAALTIGLGGAEAPGPEQGGGPWLAVE